MCGKTLSVILSNSKQKGRMILNGQKNGAETSETRMLIFPPQSNLILGVKE